jgi:hypothetical protein
MVLRMPCAATGVASAATNIRTSVNIGVFIERSIEFGIEAADVLGPLDTDHRAVTWEARAKGASPEREIAVRNLAAGGAARF